MIIGNFSALFLLLLIPLILLLHILLRRMESHTVSSLLIWERVKKKRRYRFPTILLLILQILVVSLFALSLSDIKVPFTLPLRRENSVLIIDNSASMKVEEEGKSRLEDAKEKAINVIKGSSGEVMIITSAQPPEILTSYTANRNELISAVRSIRGTDLSNGIEEAMKIASASVTSPGSIIMISDGSFDYIPSETDNFKFIRAGKERTQNIGITDFYLREKNIGDSYELYISIGNFSAAASDYKLIISKNDEIITEESGAIEIGEIIHMVYDIESEPDKEISALLIADDLLAADNRSSAYISSSTRKRILLVTPGNFFLERAIESIPGVFVEKFTGMLESDTAVQAQNTPRIYSSSGIPVQKIPDNFDVVIFDRIPPPQSDDTGRFIYIDVIPSGIRSDHEKIEPQAVSINGNHPVLDSVDFSKVTVLKAWPPLAGPQITELVSGGNTGLLYALDSKFLKFVYLPFDLTDSDLPLRASFPILINNSIRWLTDGFAREEIIQYRTGDSFLIGRAEPDFQESRITSPSGKKMTIPGNLFSETRDTGLYRFEYANESYYGSVNLNNSDESDISSRFPEVTEEDREEKTGEYKFPVMSLLLILSLILLITEWMVQEDKW